MIDQQIPDWQEDALLDLLVGLFTCCSDLSEELPPDPGVAPAEDPFLDLLVGYAVLSQKIRPLLGPESRSEAAVEARPWPAGLLR